MLRRQRVDLQTDQLVEPHLQDRVGLRLGEAQLSGVRLRLAGLEAYAFRGAVHQAVLRHGPVLRSAQDLYDQVDHIHGSDQAFLDLLLLEVRVQHALILPGGDLKLEVDVGFQDIPQGQGLWPAVGDCQHIDAEGILQARLLVQQLLDIGCVGSLAQLHDDPDPFLGGLVRDVGDVTAQLAVRQGRHIVQELPDACADHGIGDLGDHQALTVRARHLLDLHAAPHLDPAGSRAVDLLQFGTVDDDAAGGKIRSLHILHQVISGQGAVPDEGDHGVDHLPQIVGRNGRGHADGDALGTVHQQVRDARRKDRRFLLVLIEVGDEVHDPLLQIRQKCLLGDLLKPGFRIAHGGGAVALDGPEVPVAVYQGNAHLEILGHDHQSAVDGAVTVGMVFTHGVAHDPGGLAVGSVPADAEFIHVIQRTALNGLQSVPHIRQSPGHDHAHGVINVGLAHDLRVLCLNQFICHNPFLYTSRAASLACS